MQKRIKILCVGILFSFLLFFCGQDVMVEAEESNKGNIDNTSSLLANSSDNLLGSADTGSTGKRI